MRVLAFAASNNEQSINALLAAYAAELIPAALVETLNIHDYEMPLFSNEREVSLGQPDQALAFWKKIADADAIIISFAEHNGNVTAAYKNLVDWTSRINTRVFQQKPAVFLATSPGKGGAENVLASAVQSAPYFGADLRASLSIPSFHENFDVKRNEMINARLRQELTQAVLLLDDAQRIAI